MFPAVREVWRRPKLYCFTSCSFSSAPPQRFFRFSSAFMFLCMFPFLSAAVIRSAWRVCDEMNQSKHKVHWRDHMLKSDEGASFGIKLMTVAISGGHPIPQIRKTAEFITFFAISLPPIWQHVSNIWIYRKITDLRQLSGFPPNSDKNY